MKFFKGATRTSPAYWQAVSWLLLSCVAFATLWVAIRFGSKTIHPFALVFYRNLGGCILVLPWILASRGRILKTRNLKSHTYRATSGTIATFTTFYAIAHAPIATVLSITYAAPLIASAFSVLFLSERMNRPQVLTLFLGFLGVLIVLRPSQLPFDLGVASAVIAAVFTAFSLLFIKALTYSEDTFALVIWSYLLMLPPSFLFALPFIEFLDPKSLPPIAAISVLALIGQLGTANAFKRAPASEVMPYDFVRFCLVILYGWLILGEKIDWMTAIGSFLILGSIIYLVRSQANRMRMR